MSETVAATECEKPGILSAAEQKRLEGGETRGTMTGTAAMSAREAARDVIYRSAILLDGQKTEEWLRTLCAPDFLYAITTYSPEIRREQEWFEATRDELLEMQRLLPRHNTDHSPLARHVSVYTVEVSDDGKFADAISSVSIYVTMLDGTEAHLDSGQTHLFCIGKYHDRLDLTGERPLLQARNLRLDTRRLDRGSHAVL